MYYHINVVTLFDDINDYVLLVLFCPMLEYTVNGIHYYIHKPFNKMDKNDMSFFHAVQIITKTCYQ